MRKWRRPRKEELIFFIGIAFRFCFHFYRCNVILIREGEVKYSGGWAIMGGGRWALWNGYKEWLNIDMYSV